MGTARFSRRRFATGSAVAAASLVAPGAFAGQLPKPSSTPGGDAMLPSLLAMTPDIPGKDQGEVRESRFANLVPLLDLAGLAPLGPGDDPTDPRRSNVFTFAGIPYDGLAMATDPERWLELFGFHPFQIQAMLEQGPTDDAFLLFRGAFDRDNASAAWEETGYVAGAGSDGIWSLGLDDSARSDLAFDSGFIGFLGGSYSFAAFLDDETVALASDIASIEEAQRATSDRSRSLLGNPAIQALAHSMGRDQTRVLVLPGGALQEEVGLISPGFSAGQRDEILQALESIEDQYGPMPEIESAILGRAPGGPDREETPAALDLDEHATFEASIAPVDPDQAQMCLDIATARFDALYSLSLLERYRDLLALESAETDGGIAHMTFTRNGDANHDLFDFYYVQDLQFLYW